MILNGLNVKSPSVATMDTISTNVAAYISASDQKLSKPQKQ